MSLPGRDAGPHLDRPAAWAAVAVSASWRCCPCRDVSSARAGVGLVERAAGHVEGCASARCHARWRPTGRIRNWCSRRCLPAHRRAGAAVSASGITGTCCQLGTSVAPATRRLSRPAADQRERAPRCSVYCIDARSGGHGAAAGKPPRREPVRGAMPRPRSFIPDLRLLGDALRLVKLKLGARPCVPLAICGSRAAAIKGPGRPPDAARALAPGITVNLGSAASAAARKWSTEWPSRHSTGGELLHYRTLPKAILLGCASAFRSGRQHPSRSSECGPDWCRHIVCSFTELADRLQQSYRQGMETIETSGRRPASNLYPLSGEAILVFAMSYPTDESQRFPSFHILRDFISVPLPIWTTAPTRRHGPRADPRRRFAPEVS